MSKIVNKITVTNWLSICESNSA